MRPERVSRRSLDRHLAVYKETWLAEHELVKELWQVEDVIDDGVSLFGLMQRRIASWRKRLALGQEPYLAEDDAALRSYLGIWIEVSSRVL